MESKGRNPAPIAVLGTCDSKGHELAFLAERIRERGHMPLLVDVGTGDAPQVAPDVTRHEVAAGGGIELDPILERCDRGECVEAMSRAAPSLVARLAEEGRIRGIVSLGGGGGTAIATAAMRALPIGFPKLMISTLASGNTAPYVGTTDLVMMPSIVDVAGLNRLSRTLFTRAAGAICGMVEAEPTADEDRPLVVASMFGNTTDAVNRARERIEQAGYEVLVFHATGTGGRAMESLIASGMVRGVLDITTTEWADEWAGGVLSAGPERLEATAGAAVPSIVVPGCLDMVNFGEPDTIPARYEGRTFYRHNPQITLMRTTPEECAELGRILAEKVNRYPAPVTMLLPLRTVSIIGAEGQPFHDPEADRALFGAIRDHLNPDIELRELDAAINDDTFADACAEALLRNLERHATA